MHGKHPSMAMPDNVYSHTQRHGRGGTRNELNHEYGLLRQPVQTLRVFNAARQTCVQNAAAQNSKCPREENCRVNRRPP